MHHAPSNTARWPADRLERRAVEALVLYARNVRTHSSAQIAKIAAAIQEWSGPFWCWWMKPAASSLSHGRILAAKKLGSAELPVMVAAGFSDRKLGKLMPRSVDGDANTIPPAPSEPVSRHGDLWVLGDHPIIYGDSTDPAAVASLLAGDKSDMMVTDPPYGVDHDPEWRNRAGVSTTEQLGKVESDHRADWGEA